MTDAAIMLMDPTFRPGRWAEAMRSFADAGFRMEWRAKAQEQGEEQRQARPYLVQGGVAVLPIYGPMSKDPFIELFGGASSERLAASVRAASADPEVGSILLLVDSPGGDVAGTEELGAAVADAGKRVPVHAHVEDMAASAAYWVASQARTITANATAWVGSIGTLMVIPDTSKAWEAEGVKWHVIASPADEFKGALLGAAGISEKALKYAQELVDPLTAEFKAAIAKGRGKSARWADTVATGRMWGAREAMGLGLVDGIGLRDGAGATAMASAAETFRSRNKSRAERVVRRTAAAAGIRRIRPA